MSNSKTKRITFRVEERLFKFLDEFSTTNKMDVSSLCRYVITQYFMSFLLGEIRGNVKDRFLKKYGGKR
jgi:hypothetical protein